MPYTDSGIWVPPPGYERCTWVSDGEEVFAPFDSKGTGIKCVVEKACGNYARVVNAQRDFAKWFDVLELVRKKP